MSRVTPVTFTFALSVPSFEFKEWLIVAVLFLLPVELSGAFASNTIVLLAPPAKVAFVQ